MTVIVEEGPQEVDEEDLVEKHMLGNLLINKFESEIDEL